MSTTKIWSLAGLKLGVIVLLLFAGCDTGEKVDSAGTDAKTPLAPLESSGENRNQAAPEVVAATKPSAKSNTKPRGKSEPKTESKLPVEPDLNDARFHAAIKKVAGEYLGYGLVNTRVNEIAVPKVASQLCAPAFQTVEVEPEPRLSGASSDKAHGKKLYFLFAKDIAHYTNRDGSSSPVGQVLVKEAWSSKPGNPNARNLRTHASAVRISPRVKVDDQTLEIGQRTDLFVMIKQAKDAAGTDEGWVYGVIDADSQEVKSAGAVSNCIACHDGQRDRLFRDGIPNWDAQAKDLISAANSTANDGAEDGNTANKPNAAIKPNAAK